MVNGMKGGRGGGWKERWREKRNREGKRHNWKRRRRRGEEWWGKRMKILRPLVVSRKRKVALWRIDLRMGREYRQGRTRREPSINWIESGNDHNRNDPRYVYSDHTIGLQLRYRQFRKSLAFSLTFELYFSSLAVWNPDTEPPSYNSSQLPHKPFYLSWDFFRRDGPMDESLSWTDQRKTRSTVVTPLSPVSTPYHALWWNLFIAVLYSQMGGRIWWIYCFKLRAVIA